MITKISRWIMENWIEIIIITASITAIIMSIIAIISHIRISISLKRIKEKIGTQSSRSLESMIGVNVSKTLSGEHEILLNHIQRGMQELDKTQQFIETEGLNRGRIRNGIPCIPL